MSQFSAEEWMDVKSYVHTPAEFCMSVEVNKAIDNTNKAWETNALCNESLFNSINSKYLPSIFGQWNGLNCLVVGAGNSSTNSLHQIKKKKEAGWKVVSVDRAHQRLKDYGITPDLTVTCDASGMVEQFLRKMDKDDKIAINIYQNPTTARMLDKRAGESYWFSLINPFSPMIERWFKKYNHDIFALRAGYIVGFAAVDLAYRMGCKKIVTIGNDLCWHSLDDIEDFIKVEGAILKANVEGIDHPIFTLEAFLQASGIFKMFPDLHPEVDWIDCSNGIMQGFRRVKILNNVMSN